MALGVNYNVRWYERGMSDRFAEGDLPTDQNTNAIRHRIRLSGTRRNGLDTYWDLIWIAPLSSVERNRNR